MKCFSICGGNFIKVYVKYDKTWSPLGLITSPWLHGKNEKNNCVWVCVSVCVSVCAQSLNPQLNPRWEHCFKLSFDFAFYQQEFDPSSNEKDQFTFTLSRGGNTKALFYCSAIKASRMVNKCASFSVRRLHLLFSHTAWTLCNPSTKQAWTKSVRRSNFVGKAFSTIPCLQLFKSTNISHSLAICYKL